MLHRKPASVRSLTSFFLRQPSHFSYVPLTANPTGLLILASAHREPALFLPFSPHRPHLLAGLMVQDYAQ